MGNANVCHHRIRAILTAMLGTIALGFSTMAGTSCDFVHVTAASGTILQYINEEGMNVNVYDANLGVFCDDDSETWSALSPLFARQGDSSWTLSFAFWAVSVFSGSVAVMISWLVATCMAPTEWNWRNLSLFAGVAAATQGPVFLIFLSHPCVENTCSVSTGSLMLMISLFFYITLTMLTQCLDPPLWSRQLDVWRADKQRDMMIMSPSSPKRRHSSSSWWQRWRHRRQWARGLASTASGSANDGEEITDQEQIIMMEQGASFYAGSNGTSGGGSWTSRSLLQVPPVGEDQKSMDSFSDLTNDVKYAEEQRRLAATSPIPLEMSILKRKNSSRSMTKQEKSNPDTVDLTPKEVIIIHSHKDSTFRYQKPEEPPQQHEEEKTEEKPLLLVHDYDENSISEMCAPFGKKKKKRSAATSGMKGMTKRMGRSSKHLTYYELDGANTSFERESDADDEMDQNSKTKGNSKPTYSSPMTPAQLQKLSQEEVPSPFEDAKAYVFAGGAQGLTNNELLHNWNALHTAASGGILLPRSISIFDVTTSPPTAVSGPSSGGSEEEPKRIYSSDDDHSELSLTSFGDHPDDEEFNEIMSSSTMSSGESSADDGNGSSNKRKNRSKGGTTSTNRSHRKTYSCTNSVASRGSLLELTIQEEDDEEDDDSSAEENPKHLSKNYPLRPVKSAPDRFSFPPPLHPDSPYRLTQARSTPPKHMDLPNAGSTSEDSDESPSSQVLCQATGLSRVAPMMVDNDSHVMKPRSSRTTTTSNTNVGSLSDDGSGTGVFNSNRSNTRGRSPRCRLACVIAAVESSSSNKNDYSNKISPPSEFNQQTLSSDYDTMDDFMTRSPKRVTHPPPMVHTPPRFREERLDKAGIHSTHINIISDESSSEDDNKSSKTGGGKSVQSTVSGRARQARMKRLNAARERRRSHTLDPPKKRKEAEIMFDPTLRAILVTRGLGVEYGPDEASL